MIDIETKVAASLCEYAEATAGVDRLHQQALSRAATIRRRQHAAGAVVAAGLAAVVTAGVAGLPSVLAGRGSGGGGLTLPVGTAQPPTPPVTGGPTTLPGAAGVPSATEQPAAVGTDPSLLHFDLDLAALDVASAAWTSGVGYEAVNVPDAAGRPAVEVLIGTDADRLEAKRSGPAAFLRVDGSHGLSEEEGPRTPTTVDGRPATIQQSVVRLSSGDRYRWTLRWQPVDGLYALVSVFDADPARPAVAAAALRLDRAQRCATPLRLAAIPDGARWTVCKTTLRRSPVADRGVWVNSELVLDLTDGTRASVWAEEAVPRHSLDTSQFVPNRTVAGEPAQWRTESPEGLWLLGFGSIGEVFIGGTDEPRSIQLAGGLTVSADLADPHRWPVHPIA